MGTLNITDHVYFVHPLTNTSVDISTDTRPMYQSTYWSSIGRHVNRNMGRESIDMSTEMCRSTYRPTNRSRCVGRHIDRHIGRALVNMSTDTRPICWPICRRRVILQLSADMSIDSLPTFRRYFTDTCPCLRDLEQSDTYSFILLS